ncbi:uncharacterized protein METZ01_LOCUS255595 [marine metagenome]|uniref:Uncharacterized protein n=1 Tax=marine metagenome TaxID=408172 RepID=A0A382IVY7_9ZZZZ
MTLKIDNSCGAALQEGPLDPGPIVL